MEINMSNTFTIDGVTYKIVRNPHTKGPMIARVDNLPIENRKEICRHFLRMHGWSEFPNEIITNTLEREINKIVNDGEMPIEVGIAYTSPKKQTNGKHASRIYI